jgi:GNAT superfamily N-acetyltransferase
MRITVEPLTESLLDRAYEIHRAGWDHDVPDIPSAPLAAFRAALRSPWPGNTEEGYVGLLDGQPVGSLGLRLPQRDNLDSATVEIRVLPEHRRLGVGRALWAHAVTRARALGRKRLFGQTVQRFPDGDAFAAAMGATAALAETRSRLDVATADLSHLDGLRADGYRLVRWTGLARDEWLDDVAYLDSRFNLDAPQGDLEVEQEIVDARQVREIERAQTVRRRTTFHAGAVHVATGRLVAWTFLAGSDDRPWQAWQNITLVHPEHRGHRLGLLVKLDNLRHIRAARPELRAIDTFNATANERMLAINQTMGFRAVDSWAQWQWSE